MTFERAQPDGDEQMVPRYAGSRGRVEVDATWGTIQPIQISPGVRTIGELELIEHLEAGRPAIDTRLAEYREQARIPGTVGIPHEEIADRLAELDRDRLTAFFCNGPACTATPLAIRALLDAGFAPDRILYYRGGLHDWMTLGLPVEGGRAQE